MDTKITSEKMKIAMECSSFSELAEKLNITLPTIDSWKKRNAIPNKYLLKIAEKTGVSLDWLLDEDKPTFHISGGSKNISQVNGNVNQGSDIKTEDELDLFEEFKKMENLAKMANKVDFLKDELAKIKEKLKQYI
jgi:transcriptional regulator with XRE-family HTH domain